MSRIDIRRGFTHIASAVKSVVQTAISEFNKVVLNLCSFRKLCGVHKVGRTELLGPCLLGGVGVDGDDAGGTNEDRCVDDTETNGSDTEYSNSGTLCTSFRIHSLDDWERTNSWLLCHCTPSGGDTTPKKANFLKGSSLVYRDNRNISNHGILREC